MPVETRRGRVLRPRGTRERRTLFARVIVLTMTAGLLFAFLRVQVMSGERYALIAKSNRLRPLEERAPRGTIYDRHGRVIAENRVGYQILLMPGPRDQMEEVIERLRPVLGLTDAGLRRAWRKFQQAPNLPMTVLNDADPRAVARLQERQLQFPGVLVREYPQRHYPAGQSVAHMIGYVNEISEQELELPEFVGYQQGRWIGKSGLERQYETQLGGEPGVRYLEVDARGRIKRWLPEEMGVPPIPGRDLHLYLDLDLQEFVGAIFDDVKMHLPGEDTIMGAFVALDPRTGGVLAYYSTPGFDPNVFIGGIPADVWTALNEDPTKPLLNRASGNGSPAPPGSTFKLQVAAMALDLGVIAPEEFMPIPCTGGMSYQGRYARCWGVHGRQDLTLGIKNSCDVYFYQVGIRIGLDRFLEMGTKWGFADRTGIDLPNESRSIFPTGRAWMEKWFGYPPPDNEIMSLSIGQGAVTMTPLKMAHMFVPLARADGKAPAPRFVRTEEEPPITFELPITPEQIGILRAGMRRVVGPGGTAAMTRIPYWDFMGKTGTSQNAHGDDHAWFVGIGGPPGGEPEIVASAFIAHGLHGYVASETVASAINFYLDRKYGRPFERYPVPRVRNALGLPVDWAWLYSEVQDHPVTGG